MNFKNFANFLTGVSMKKIFFVWALFVSSLFPQGTIGTLPEIISPDVNDVMWLQTASTDYKITLASIYNKLLGRNNEWIGSNTFNGLTNFDSSVVMRGSQSYYSNNYTPGWLGSGFNLDYGKTYANESNLVIDNMTVRGTLSVYELLLRRINATNGNFAVAAAAKINAIGVAPDSTLLFVEDPTGNGLAPFAKNDLVMVSVYAPGSNSITRFTKATVDTVYTYTQPLTFLKFAAVGITYDEGTKPKGGDVLVRMGNRTDSTRMNLIYMSSEDDGAPFMQFKRGIDDWAKVNDESTTILYMGNLDGYNDPDFGALEGDGSVLKNLYAKGSFEITGGSARDEIDSLVAANLLLGDMAYEDIVELAKLGSTIIQGGYIKTTLINAAALVIGSGQVTGLGDLATMNEAQINYLNILNTPNLGDLAYEDLVELSKLGSTIVLGGYIKTNLLDVDEIFSQNITATGTITGVTLRTAATGQRVVISGTSTTYYSQYDQNVGSIYGYDNGLIGLLTIAGTNIRLSGNISTVGDLGVTGNLGATGYLSITGTDGIYLGGDVNLFRSSANNLNTAIGDNFNVGGNLTITGSGGANGDFVVGGDLYVTGSYGLLDSDIPNLSTAKITSGTFGIARIPTGTTSTTVALGNHNHSGIYANASHTHAQSDITGAWGTASSFVEAIGSADVTFYYRPLTIGGTTVNVIYDVQEVP